MPQAELGRTVSDLQGSLTLLTVLTTFIGGWWWILRTGWAARKRRAMRHMAGFIAGTCAALSGLVVCALTFAVDPGWGVGVLLACVAYFFAGGLVAKALAYASVVAQFVLHLVLGAGALVLNRFSAFEQLLTAKSAQGGPKPLSLGPPPVGSTGRRVSFRYIDAYGRRTRRTVSVAIHGDETFDAFCETRQGLRTFRYDRIQGDVVDLDTGEVLDVEDWRFIACSV